MPILNKDNEEIELSSNVQKRAWKRRFALYAIIGLLITGTLASVSFYALYKVSTWYDSNQVRFQSPIEIKSPIRVEQRQTKAEPQQTIMLAVSQAEAAPAEPIPAPPIDNEVEMLRSYLKSNNAASLMPYAAEIVKLPRWQEALAIASHETAFCTTGVGRSRNNCGGITGGKDGFKRYANKFDGLADISVLLNKPAYRNKTIAQMNGTYCVNNGGPCPNWTEKINGELAELRGFLKK